MNDIMQEAIAEHCKKYKYSKSYQAYWTAYPFCEVCGNFSTAPHHIRTRGAGGNDESGNLLALCTTHHTEAHTMGIQSFANKYEQFYEKIAATLDFGLVGSVKEDRNDSKQKG